jgi:hypothetical protein
MVVQLTEPESVTMLAKIYAGAPLTAGTSCRLWQGSKQPNKKGMIHVSVGTKIVMAHTFVFRYVKKLEIPKGMKLVRSCEDILCFNPDHLQLAPKKNEYDPDKMWESLLQKGTKLDNGCLVTKQPYMNVKTATFGQTGIHRLAYMIHNKLTSIPLVDADGAALVMRHLCNDGRCFNPEHLKLGTDFENNFDDKIANGTLVRGEAHHGNTISEATARAIKLSKPSTSRYAPGHVTQTVRAEKFKVPLQVVKCIDSGKSWAHLPDAVGKTGSSRKLKARVLRKNARERAWTPKMFDEAAARIKAKLQIATEPNIHTGTACHEWTGPVGVGGYGRITLFGRLSTVHDVIMEALTKTFLEKGQVVRHLCGNRKCCCEQHLRVGTTRENAQDTVDHGNCKLAKLDAAKVRDIRSVLKDDNTAKERRVIADKYGVNIGTIKDIMAGKTWKHIMNIPVIDV